MVDKIWYNMEELIGGSEERGINRNIVECKDASAYGFVIVPVCINRNIVECKGLISSIEKPQYLVLIETQWNVKEVSIANKAQTEMVLIETQWNVKKVNTRE